MTLSTATIATPDYIAIKGRQQQTWASGDYHVIAAIIHPISERLSDAIDLRAGERVLDVATGSGNAAIAAARRLCDVTGVDYVPALLQRAQQRAAAEGFPITFVAGDAEALPVEDDTYDVVLSVVGSMFAPNQAQAANELLRVCRPGGRIGLANWTPDGFIGEMLRTVGRHVPPPAGLHSPSRWGTEDGLHDLFDHGVEALRIEKQAFVWHFSSAQQFLDLFRAYYGPVHKAFAALDEAGQAALASDLIAAVLRFNRSYDDTLVVPADYLEVVAVKR